MKLILACTPSGGIGYKNKLPWTNIQGDLPRFKRLTQNQIVVMGRNTWDSLPMKPLPNRLNLVVSSSPLTIDVAIQIPNLTALRGVESVWLIGGAKLIDSSWDMVNEVHLTRVHANYTCDVFANMLILQQKFSVSSVVHNDDHDYEIWKRDSY